MKYSGTWVAGASWVLLIASCGPKVEPKVSFNPANTEAEVRTMLADYAEAQRQNGVLGELPFLDTTDAFFWVPPGYTKAINGDSVRAVLQKFAPSIRSVDGHWLALDVHPLNDSIAVYTGRLRATNISIAGDSTTHELLETGVVARRVDGWKLLGGHTTVLPAQ